MAAGRVIVVGAGVAGLVAAAQLARRGIEVTVLERAPHVGGKVRQLVVDGAAIDAGPTVLTLRPLLEEAFAEAGAELADHLTLNHAEVLARHAWSAGERLDLYADADRSAAAIADFAGRREGANYLDFCAKAKRTFDTLYEPFMRRAEPSFPGLMWRAGLVRLSYIDPYSSLWTMLGRQFADPRLRQLFGRYATYVGASPMRAPATMMLIAHVEQAGVWLVEGGMARLTEALARVAARNGADIRLGTEAAEINVDADGVSGVRLGSGEAIAARAVVCNADVAALAAGRLGHAAGRGYPRRRHRSLSAVTFALHAEARGFPLSRHNVFFSNDYAAEFRDLEAGRPPAAPSVYVCAQDRGAGLDDAAPPSGPERLLCLINAPATGDAPHPDASEVDRCEQSLTARLTACGLTLRTRPQAMQATTPRDFEALFPGTGGALYGPATRNWTSAFRRPGAQGRILGLYHAGGGAHPGPGVPMAALSGTMAARRVTRDLDSRARSRRTATPGGTSTP